jgi:hypothetical protein
VRHKRGRASQRWFPHIAERVIGRAFARAVGSCGLLDEKFTAAVPEKALSMSIHGATKGTGNMTLKELADKLAALDEDAFVAALQLEYTHDDEPGQVKAMMIDALRFAESHGMKAAQPPLDSAD